MNLLDMICKELGVELEEEWEATDGYTYAIESNGILVKGDNNDMWEEVDMRDLLLGEMKPIWRPRMGDIYYTPDLSEAKLFAGDVKDAMFYHDELIKNGVAFKTKEEAIEMAKRMLKLTKEI